MVNKVAEQARDETLGSYLFVCFYRKMTDFFVHFGLKWNVNWLSAWCVATIVIFYLVLEMKITRQLAINIVRAEAICELTKYIIGIDSQKSINDYIRRRIYPPFLILYPSIHLSMAELDFVVKA